MDKATLNKVINMNDYLANSGKHSDQLINECRNLMNNHLIKSVSTVMDKVDDMLFDLSHETGDTDSRTHYFYAMREMRLKRDDIEATFKDKLNSLIDNGLRGIADVPNYQLKSSEIEETVALKNTIAKANNECREALLNLDQRMKNILNKPELETVINPLRPEAICSAFQQACEDINSDIEIKLILFKLFDKYVTSGLPTVYKELSSLLEIKSVKDSMKDIKIQDQQIVKDRTYYLRANQLIKNTIDGRPNVVSLPDFAKSFLYHQWSKLLLKIYIRDGADGAAWLHAVDVIDDLVNCIGEHTSVKEKQSLSGLIPNLKQRLRYGMNVIPVTPMVRDEFLSELTQYYKGEFQKEGATSDVQEKPETEDITVPKFSSAQLDQSMTPFMSELLMDDKDSD